MPPFRNQLLDRPRQIDPGIVGGPSPAATNGNQVPAPVNQTPPPAGAGLKYLSKFMAIGEHPAVANIVQSPTAPAPVQEPPAATSEPAPRQSIDYGLRADGTKKGAGFLGELKRPDGGISTELSIGVKINGKETEIPTIIPGLTKGELNTLLTIKDGEQIPVSIVRKAVAHAKERIEQGKSPFSDGTEIENGQPAGNNIQSVISDPNFLALPVTERQKVMQKLDPNFSGLPPEEQIKVVSALGTGGNPDIPDEMFQAHRPGPEPELMPAHEPTVKAPEDSLAKQTARAVSPLLRPAVEGGGMVGGAILGAPAGGVTAVPSAGAGYAISKGLMNKLDQWSGLERPKSLPEETIAIVKDTATGAAYEIGGQVMVKALVPVIRGGKYAFKRSVDAVKGMFSKKAMEQHAGRILMAHTSEGPIFAKNAKQAADIEKRIPGLKFTRGQLTNDPKQIKLERAEIRKPGMADELNAEQIANNNEALRNYYSKNFGGKEGVDDLVGELERRQYQLDMTAAEQQAAAGQILSDAPARPQRTGNKIIEEVERAKKPIKKAMGKMGKKIPEYPMEFRNVQEKILAIKADKTISPTQKKVVEDLQKTFDEMLKKGKSTFTATGLRREINDRRSELYRAGRKWAADLLGDVKKALLKDIDEVTKKARSGKIAEFDGKVVNPDEIAAQIEKDSVRLAKAKSVEKPDLQAMKKALNDTGYPTMQVVHEGNAEYAKRVLRDYKATIGGDPPMITDDSQKTILKELKDRVARNMEILSKVSPGQDVAASMKAYNEFASTEYFGRFDVGAVKTATKRGAEAAGTARPIETIPSYFTSESGAQDLIRAIGKKPASGIMRGHYAYDMLRKATNPEGQIVSSKLKTWLNNNGMVLEKYGIKKEFTGLLKAQKVADAAKKAAIDFEKSIAGKILKADPEKAIANAIKGNNSGKAAQELMDMVSGNQAAVEGLRKAFADHIISKVQTTAKDIAGNPTISNAAFQKILANYEPALKVLFKDRPKQAMALRNMRDAYEIMIRNTKSPAGGGSDTAENVFTALSKAAGLSHTTNTIERVVKFLGRYSKKKVDELLVRSFFDPEYAQTLINSVKIKTSTSQMKKQLSGKIVMLDDYRKSRAAAAAAGMAAGADDRE
jgi:hypothetical protein